MKRSRITGRDYPLAVAAGLLYLLISGAPVGAAEPAPARVVAIGDIHGEYEGLVEILQEADLIDAERRWVGGDAVVVQTGDFTDRGRDVRAVMDLLMALQEQAAEQGGEVIALLGNHEQMNIVGEFRSEYVTPEILATFADEGSEERRQVAYRRWLEWRREYPEFPERDREEWMAERPPGFFEYLEAMGPEGEYGRWLRTLPVAVRLGETVFMHAGISPEYSAFSLAEINALHHQEFEAFDKDREFLAEQGIILPFFSLQQINQVLVIESQRSRTTRGRLRSQRVLLQKVANDFNSLARILASESPLWFRGFSQWPQQELEPLLAKLSKKHGAQRFVVAHTPQITTRIETRMGGRIFLIDTGMLRTYYGGQAAALEIQDGRFTAIYLDERTVLLGRGTDAQPATLQKSVRRERGMGGAAFASFPSPRDPGPGGAEPARRRWLDPDGQPLPFQGRYREAEDFLRGARVVSEQAVPVGVTKPRQLLLERDGVQARAVFHTVDEVKERSRMGDGTFVMYLRDSYLNQMAAYELARHLGVDAVPPTVLRTVGGNEGSVQLWIEDTFSELERRQGDLRPPSTIRFNRQVWDMDIFDNLINNIDRNQTNILIDQDWNIWYIDNTRSFGRDRKLHKPDFVLHCSRGLWQRLRQMDEEEVTRLLDPYMGRYELKALFSRRQALVKLLEKRISRFGEENVLFSHGDADRSVVIIQEEASAGGRRPAAVAGR